MIGGIGQLCRNLRRSRSGSAAVEFALLMIFIILPLFFGLFEFSRALHQHQIILKSVRDAARFAAKLPRPEFAPPYTAFEDPCVAGSANAALDIKNLAMYGNLTTTNLPPLLPGWTDRSTLCIMGPSVTADFTSQGGTLMSGRTFVRVTATVPYQDLGLFTLVGGAFNITAQHEEPYIGE